MQGYRFQLYIDEMLIPEIGIHVRFSIYDQKKDNISWATAWYNQAEMHNPQIINMLRKKVWGNCKKFHMGIDLKSKNYKNWKQF